MFGSRLTPPGIATMLVHLGRNVYKVIGKKGELFFWTWRLTLRRHFYKKSFDEVSKFRYDIFVKPTRSTEYIGGANLWSGLKRILVAMQGNTATTPQRENLWEFPRPALFYILVPNTCVANADMWTSN